MFTLKKTILVIGLASNKVVREILIPDNFPKDLSLMNFLMDKGITIASSCGGVGSCKKCIFNHTQLSCQITLENFIADSSTLRVEISYL